MQDLVFPRYDGESITNVPHTILKHFGLNFKRPLNRIYLSSDRLISILIDGVGYRDFMKIINTFHEIEWFKDHVKIITSTFPSTTSTALVSLSTGLEPGLHGVIGSVMYIREIGMIVNTRSLSPMISEDRDYFQKHGVNVSKFFKIETTVFNELSSVGVRTRVYLPKGLSDGISRLIYKGAEVLDYSGISDALINALTFLQDLDQGYVHIYIPTPDQVAHKYGVDSDEYVNCVGDILVSIDRILKKYVKKSISIIILSDHGLIPTGEHDVVKFEDHEYLMNSLSTPPFGEARASFIKIERDYDVDEVKQYLESRFRGFKILKISEIFSSNLLGQVDSNVCRRLGDLLILSTSTKCLDYSYRGEPREKTILKAQHGSLLSREMLTPLVILNF